jgi:hypothetical protein
MKPDAPLKINCLYGQVRAAHQVCDSRAGSVAVAGFDHNVGDGVEQASAVPDFDCIDATGSGGVCGRVSRL